MRRPPRPAILRRGAEEDGLAVPAGSAKLAMIAMIAYAQKCTLTPFLETSDGDEQSGKPKE
jgi:hypothetical protein